MMLLPVLDLISFQRAPLGLGVVDDWYWPMLYDCRYNGKRRGQGYRLLHEIHHALCGGEGGGSRTGEQGGQGIVYNRNFYDGAR